MKIRTAWLTMLAVVLASFSVACSPVLHQKAGIDVNNGFETAVVAVETGLFEWPKSSADGAAATATPETSVGLVGPGPQAIPVGTCQFHTSAALTANSANFATITIFKRTNGGSATTLASLSTTTTNWNAFTNIAIPLAATPEFVSPGDSITVAITKSGTGVIVPQGQLACFTTIN
jgi:hypothetical protein